MLCKTPNSSSSNPENVRNVNSSGGLNNNNAYYGNRGVRPALMEHRDRVYGRLQPAMKAEDHLSKESISLPSTCKGKR